MAAGPLLSRALTARWTERGGGAGLNGLCAKQVNQCWLAATAAAAAHPTQATGGDALATVALAEFALDADAVCPPVEENSAVVVAAVVTVQERHQSRLCPNSKLLRLDVARARDQAASVPPRHPTTQAHQPPALLNGLSGQ
eukprot:CAMPEP_0115467640 /NCGR_PEP_ID=MMETSP0271-20121206/50542_1 /TAXON_ID=71861 /ORGANISM="Scrippsiella trochoidea, Strain CCMP3099" /LENGTH=140 /DNA_ID=CAMNT_0002894661 /DNA_START=42 /DNA_END=466 /DNA_ORIENTATION=-